MTTDKYHAALNAYIRGEFVRGVNFTPHHIRRNWLASYDGPTRVFRCDSTGTLFLMMVREGSDDDARAHVWDAAELQQMTRTPQSSLIDCMAMAAYKALGGGVR